MTSKNERSPIIVNNPYRDILMNVEPLFKLIDFYSLEDAFDWADVGIKYLALGEMPEWLSNEERQSAIMFLYEVRNLFSCMKECQTAVRKKGGAA